MEQKAALSGEHSEEAHFDEWIENVSGIPAQTSSGALAANPHLELSKV
jgi:hypothetical protein